MISLVPPPKVATCRWGHPMTVANTGVRKGTKKQYCKRCSSARERTRTRIKRTHAHREAMQMANIEEPITELELHALEYHCCSSGVPTPLLVRQHVLRLIHQYRQLVPLVPCPNGHDFAIRTVVGPTNMPINKCTRCPAVEIP